MLKNKLDFKLVNLALIVLIVALLYFSGGLWGFIVSKIISILFPFLIAFAVAYAINPYVEKLINYNINKKLSIAIVILILISIFTILLTLVIPVLFEQMGSLFNGIIIFIKEMSIKYDLDFGMLQNTLSDTFNEIIKNFGNWISSGALSVVSTSFSYISTFVICIAASIYFLIDMDKIRMETRAFFKQRGDKTFNYIKLLDESMKNYMDGFTKIIIISLFEYSIVFLVIGHPNFIMLGFLAALGNLIPYFGGIFTNIIALITAFVVSPGLFIRTLIAFVILSAIDSYIINPHVYGKTNNIEPIIVIFSIFAGGILFGITGIIISLPVAIILITTYKYYKKDIEEKIEEIKIKE